MKHLKSTNKTAVLDRELNNRTIIQEYPEAINEKNESKSIKSDFFIIINLISFKKV